MRKIFLLFIVVPVFLPLAWLWSTIQFWLRDVWIEWFLGIKWTTHGFFTALNDGIDGYSASESIEKMEKDHHLHCAFCVYFKPASWSTGGTCNKFNCYQQETDAACDEYELDLKTFLDGNE